MVIGEPSAVQLSERYSSLDEVQQFLGDPVRHNDRHAVRTTRDQLEGSLFQKLYGLLSGVVDRNDLIVTLIPPLVLAPKRVDDAW